MKMLTDLSVLLLFFFGIAVIEGTVLSVGQNNGIEAIYGSKVELVCVTDAVTGYIKWYKKDHPTVMNGDVGKTLCSLGVGCFPEQVEGYGFSTSNTNQLVNIPNVNRNDENWWICTNASAVSDSYSFYLYVKDPVTAVSMDTPGNLQVQLNELHNISCSTSYGRPAADIKFYKEINGNTAEITKNVYTTYNISGNGVTIGTLTYMPSRNDDGARIYCQANNTITWGSINASNHVIIYIIDSPDSPQIIEGFTNGGTYTMIENSTLELTCSITGGKPQPSLTWVCNGGAVVSENTDDETRVKITWTAKRKRDGPCQCTSYHPAVSTNQSVLVNVEVLYPPSTPNISIDGKNREGTVKVINNTFVSVTCSSSSKPPPTYTWRYKNTEKNGSDISQVVTMNSTLTCSATNNMKSRSKNITGKSASDISFRILYGPTKPDIYCDLYDNPINIAGHTVYVVQGENLSLKCSANGDPQPRYFWNGTEGENYTVNVTKDEVYICVSRNMLMPDYGNVMLKSASTAVHVNRLYGPQKEPSITYIHTDGQTGTLVSPFRVVENSSFRLTCNNSNGRPSPSYRWTGAGSSMAEVLNVTYIKRSPRPFYTCVVQNTMINTCGDRRPRNSSLSHNVTVDVLYPAVLGLHQNQNAVEGTDVLLTAKVTTHGNPRETYKWLYSKTDTGTKIVLADGLHYTIQNVSRNDTGYYVINATNIINPTGIPAFNKTVSQTFWLDIFYTTSISNFTIGEQQGNVTYNENDTDIEVRCHVDSNPSSDMELFATTYHTEGKIAERKSDNMIVYTIGTATCFDTGTYRCVGSNEYTRAPVSMEARLFVRCSPRPRYPATQNITVYTALNDSVTLNLTVIAYPEPSPEQFHWEKINGTITTNLTNGANVNISVVNQESYLTIHSLQQKDFGQYRLMIYYNTTKFYSHYFFIQPQDRPQMPTYFTYIEEILSETTAGFQWLPGLDGGLEQTFYVVYKKASDLIWNYVIVLTNKVTLTGLASGTLYNVKMFASNSLGNSSETVILNFTTKEEPDKSTRSPTALIGGAAGGVTALLVIVVVVLVVVLYRRTSRPTDSQSDRGRRTPTQYDNEDSMTSGGQVNRGHETYYNINRNPYEDLRQNFMMNHLYGTLDKTYSKAGGQANRDDGTYYNTDRNPYEELRHSNIHKHQYGTLHKMDADAGESESRFVTDKTYENLRLSPVGNNDLSAV